jgi:hypothetical protein
VPVSYPPLSVLYFTATAVKKRLAYVAQRVLFVADTVWLLVGRRGVLVIAVQLAREIRDSPSGSRPR